MIINLSNIATPIAKILDSVLCGSELTEQDATALLQCDGKELKAVMDVAHSLRLKTNGKTTSYVVTRNINFTNVCYMACRFCNYGKAKDDASAELLSLNEIVARASQAHQRGATEVCIQGGLHPDISPYFYRDIVQAIKNELPELHIHAFSPFEIYYGARKSRTSYVDFLADLKQAGLGSVPGTAAEILDTQVRQRLTKNKLSTQAWLEIIEAAHQVGLASTATMMYGHVDSAHHWADHMVRIRELQKRTGGFTEFVPLGFIHYDSPLYLESTDVRPGPTRREHMAIHAVARILFHGHIDNIQASWVKLGPQLAMESQAYGVNDLGGTLMNESISRAAGALYGQEVTADEMQKMIRSAGYLPRQRTTLYGDAASINEACPDKPLEQRSPWQQQQIPVWEVA
ncbi:5-amino-6-(D-ribitylamino)uracil--L-tyrosine 4-hydroxyphenyl transferase CofH [Aestuariicella hydrocarbonica]|uniref:FO synthase n=1 Tax=Pseudomaricurvus hydrocarbonicus TaxID=1470433 RepID=A0A9E5JWJ2_9GAMM|nr:5-amino-6-(D-ribitylamino)uracil--L-tyrosine 4-hydroxyphenyl transferase CofH [Aestuariicella hydrocarbonica]NHO65876.1 5-amino-6-(D-ribitylamino)uracil--L-tyrosine 4-hydroxyphenyl transferase CofH [Aestuariicella hydrocarbonica]